MSSASRSSPQKHLPASFYIESSHESTRPRTYYAKRDPYLFASKRDRHESHFQPNCTSPDFVSAFIPNGTPSPTPFLSLSRAKLHPLPSSFIQRSLTLLYPFPYPNLQTSTQHCTFQACLRMNVIQNVNLFHINIYINCNTNS